MSRMLTASLLILGTMAAEDCGAGIGDLRESAGSKSACDACHGTLSFDVSAADGMGYTSCSGRHAPQQESATTHSIACGAGVGDLRELAASKSACDACHGTLSYDNSAAEGLGYTSCSKSSAPQPQQQFQLSAACGEGVGDLTQMTAAQSACEACSGILAFGPVAAGGVGYTACVTGGLNNEPAVQEQGPATAHFRVGSREVKVLLSMLLVFALVFSCLITRRSASSRELVAEPAEGRVAAPGEKEAAETEAGADKAKLADLYAKV